MSVTVLASESAWVEAAAVHVVDEIRGAAERRGHCHLCLAGGSTPKAVYQALAHMDLPWHQVTVTFGDERCVAPDHPESNYALAREALLGTVYPAAVHRMRGELPDRDAAARAYETLLPDRLDVLLLGMGADGHTASLFPGGSWPEGRRVVPVYGSKPPPWRLTITPLVIAAARHIVVLVRGTSKAAAVARALQGPLDPDALPIQHAMRGAWFLDAEAAALRSEEAP
jgi:6-phosphogluconolactonase